MCIVDCDGYQAYGSELTHVINLGRPLHIKEGEKALKTTSTFFFMTFAAKGIALVTGSAGALGKAIVSRLAKDGYNIALNDISKKNIALEALAEDVRRKGRKAIVIAGDITVEKDVKNLVETTSEKLGGLDVVSTTNCRTDNYKLNLRKSDDRQRWDL